MEQIKNMRLHISFICLFAFVCTPSLMAQKQSKVEKLLIFLVDNEHDKFAKNRNKLDSETTIAFAAEMKLIDLCDQIWNQQEVSLAKDFFQTYVDAVKGSFLSICQEAKVDPAVVRKRTEENINAILDEYPNKLLYAGTLVDAIKSSGYELSDESRKHLHDVYEEEIWKDFVRNKNIPKCERYLKEYAEGKYRAEAMIEYNRLLFQAIQQSPSGNNFKRFFEHEQLNSFFGERSKRESMPQALSMYDDYLYLNICKARAIASIRQAITEYEQALYLNETDKKHTHKLEYKKDSIDYETLKLEVNSPSKLGLIKEFLQTHKYKTFRDKANQLRIPFEQQLIWSSPTVTQSYSRGLLLKSDEIKNGKKIQKTYTYDDTGKLVTIKEVTEDKDLTD